MTRPSGSAPISARRSGIGPSAGWLKATSSADFRSPNGASSAAIRPDSTSRARAGPASRSRGARFCFTTSRVSATRCNSSASPRWSRSEAAGCGSFASLPWSGSCRSVPSVDRVLDGNCAVPGFSRARPPHERAGHPGNDPGNASPASPISRPTPRRSTHWRPALARASASRTWHSVFKIGIAWQGSPQNRIDRWRSFPLAHFAQLANLPGVRLVSLQKGPGTEQLAALAGQFPVAELDGRIQGLEDKRDFLDTAAVMSLLDLVVTPETAVAHLAGRLACEPGSPSPTSATGAGWSVETLAPGTRALGYSARPSWAIGTVFSGEWSSVSLTSCVRNESGTVALS